MGLPHLVVDLVVHAEACDENCVGPAVILDSAEPVGEVGVQLGGQAARRALGLAQEASLFLPHLRRHSPQRDALSVNDPCDNAGRLAQLERGHAAVLRHGVHVFEADDVGFPAGEDAVQLHAVDAGAEGRHVDDFGESATGEEGECSGQAGVDADDDAHGRVNEKLSGWSSRLTPSSISLMTSQWNDTSRLSAASVSSSNSSSLNRIDLVTIREWYQKDDGLVKLCDNDAMPARSGPVRQDPKKMRYIEWLTTPEIFRSPATKQDLAKELDVYPKTLYNWENDREFREVWHGEADVVLEEHGAVDKRQAVLDSLYEAASDPRSPRHVSAAKLYLEVIGAIGPQRIDVHVSSKALSMLSDDEIESLIARGLAEQRAEVEGGES
jgi:hypothetical protein